MKFDSLIEEQLKYSYLNEPRSVLQISSPRNNYPLINKG